MTDVVGTIRAYDAWRIAREYEDDSDLPSLYAKHLETEKELRILKAVRHCFIRDNATMVFIEQVLMGDENALKKVEATYEA